MFCSKNPTSDWNSFLGCHLSFRLNVRCETKTLKTPLHLCFLVDTGNGASSTEMNKYCFTKRMPTGPGSFQVGNVS